MANIPVELTMNEWNIVSAALLCLSDRYKEAGDDPKCLETNLIRGRIRTQVTDQMNNAHKNQARR